MRWFSILCKRSSQLLKSKSSHQLLSPIRMISSLSWVFPHYALSACLLFLLKHAFWQQERNKGSIRKDIHWLKRADCTHDRHFHIPCGDNPILSFVQWNWSGWSHQNSLQYGALDSLLVFASVQFTPLFIGCVFLQRCKR